VVVRQLQSALEVVYPLNKATLVERSATCEFNGDAQGVGGLKEGSG
jgi:hypothetical protein